MNRLRIVNLLDDFALGGVSLGLNIFSAPELAGVGDFETIAVAPDAMIGPHVDADIILCHIPPTWRRLSLMKSLRLRNPRAKLIQVEHSYSPDWERINVTHKRRFRLMVRLAFGMTDHVVAMSHSQARWMQAIGAIGNNGFSVIYPYNRREGFAAVPDMQMPVSGPLVLGTYGRFDPAKGYDHLIREFRALGPDCNMVLRIGGFGPLEEELRALAAGASNIEFCGKVTDPAQFHAGCHVFIVPSRNESYGQVANEAREAGRPIVVSRAGGLPEQVGSAGLVVDCTVAGPLRDALRSLPDLPLEAMGRSGRAATANCGPERASQWGQLLTSFGHSPLNQARHRLRQAVQPG
jgi:glycosyltransferase involved in cell wall biosynthesis